MKKIRRKRWTLRNHYRLRSHKTHGGLLCGCLQGSRRWLRSWPVHPQTCLTHSFGFSRCRFFNRTQRFQSLFETSMAPISFFLSPGDEGGLLAPPAWDAPAFSSRSTDGKRVAIKVLSRPWAAQQFLISSERSFLMQSVGTSAPCSEIASHSRCGCHASPIARMGRHNSSAE